MANNKRARRKRHNPSISSKIDVLPHGLDWGPGNKNISTLRRLQTVIDEEHENKLK